MPIFASERGSFLLDSRSLIRKILFSLLSLTVTIPLIHRSWEIFRADRIVRKEQSLQSYSQALQYDPSNSVYWWKRGRFYHYSIEAIDIPRAIQDYQRALSLNPRIGQAWLELAEVYEGLGEFSRAEEALEKAFATRRYSPITRWQAGNFYLRRGNLAKMYENFKLASEYDSGKLESAMELAWRVDPDHAAILKRLVPDTLAANRRYTDFLLSRDQLDLARAAWQRSLENEIPADFQYRVSASFGYINSLLAKNRVADAQQVWDEALQKAGTGLRDSRPRPGKPKGAQPSYETNLVWNGSFENEILQGGFDWRFTNVSEVQFQQDFNNRMEGLKCLKVTFAGSNVSLSHLFQIIPVAESRNYELEFYLRTEGLTTDQTPYFFIQGYPDPGGAALRTKLFPASSPWRKDSFPFTVQKNCQAIHLSLRRDPSSKFDNLLKGSLWLDAISIRPAQASGPVGETTAKRMN